MKLIILKLILIPFNLALLASTTHAMEMAQIYQIELQLAENSIRPEIPPLRVHQPSSFRSNLLKKYSYVDPKKVVRSDLLIKALEIYDQNESTFPNRDFMIVIDFSKNSQWSRFFVIDMKSGEVESLHTAHGEGSDLNDDGQADRFSNVSGSKQSSLGVYRTAETYTGSFGYSLRLDGLSKTNSNVRKRAIVVHGWSKMTDENEKQVLSWGCPAISETHRDRVIDSIKEGSLIFAAQ